MRTADQSIAAATTDIAAGTGVGGGSVAALGGSLAASLAAMVANLSLGKSTADIAGRLLAASAEARRLQDRLLDLIDEDIEAYESIVSARRMPNVSVEERTLRSRHLEATTVRAAEVPLATMQACREVLRICSALVTISIPTAASDLDVAAHMALAGLAGARANVLVNLADVRDTSTRALLHNACADETAAGHAIARAVTEKLEYGLGC